MSRSTKLNVGQNGMVFGDGAKLFRLEGEHICFLDNKDKRRISDRGGSPEVKIPVRDVINLLAGQQPSSGTAQGQQPTTQGPQAQARPQSPAMPTEAQPQGKGSALTPPKKEGGQPTNESGTMGSTNSVNGQSSRGDDSQVRPSLTVSAGADHLSLSRLGAEPSGDTGNVQPVPKIPGEAGGTDTPSPTGDNGNYPNER